MVPPGSANLKQQGAAQERGDRPAFQRDGQALRRFDLELPPALAEAARAETPKRLPSVEQFKSVKTVSAGQFVARRG